MSEADLSSHHMVDVVSTDALPNPPIFTPHQAPQEIIDFIAPPAARGMAAHSPLPSQPTEVAIGQSSIDMAQLLTDSRRKLAPKFSWILRGGESFDHLKGSDAVPHDEVEAQAVRTMGPDASLYYHGAEQARRLERLMVMQRLAHHAVHGAIEAQYGNSRAGVQAYRAFSKQIPNFSDQAIDLHPVVGVTHDYGEVKLGKDHAHDKKNNHLRAVEAAVSVQLSNELHMPAQDPELMDLLEQRVLARDDPGLALTAEEAAAVSGYLHPQESSDLIYKVEPQEHFKGATEPIEYELSMLRVFEAVEHNLQGVRDDPHLSNMLLRLGVSSVYNNLPTACRAAERYIAVYDFLRQNEAVITRYVKIIEDDITGKAPASDVFGSDPFIRHRKGDEPISEIEARGRLTSAISFYKKWTRKQHVARAVWETYFGTTHELTADQPDVSFLQYTAGRTYAKRPNVKVPVMKPLMDMTGTDLHPSTRPEFRMDDQDLALAA